MEKLDTMIYLKRTACLWMLALFGAVGCASDGAAQRDPYDTLPADPGRDTTLARQFNDQAVEKLEAGDFAGAEKLLREALYQDVLFGPAHNHLGKIYYHQQKFYLAAWEFQYAIKLMPRMPEPRNNLGLVFESVGKRDNAVATYEQATDLAPDTAEYICNLASAQIRRGDDDAAVRALFEELIMKETRPAWAQWARERLVMLNAKEP